MVLNLSNFSHHHPGGKFVLDQTAGRDISKFFYGGYALDGNIGLKAGEKNLAYAHSNIARKIAFSHIVGVIEKPEVQENSFDIDHSQTMDLNSSSKSFVFKTKDNLKNSDLAEYFTDISKLGQHYTVAPQDGLGQPFIEFKGTQLKRHYTIANCMKKKFY